MNPIIPLFTLVLLFTSAVSATDYKPWGITWYRDSTCSEHPKNPHVTYTGTGKNHITMSSNLVPGEQGTEDELCHDFQDSLTSFFPCEGAMDPAPLSFEIVEGTGCYIGGHAEKVTKNNKYNKYAWGKCNLVEDIPKVKAGEPVYFQCGYGLGM